MARTRNSEPGEARLVVLVDSVGNEYLSNSPAEINRLHYGQSYTFRDHGSWAEALEWLGKDAAHKPVPTHAPPPPAPDAVNTDSVVETTPSE